LLITLFVIAFVALICCVVVDCYVTFFVAVAVVHTFSRLVADLVAARTLPG